MKRLLQIIALLSLSPHNTVPGQARYLGHVIEICHNPLRSDGQPILLPGQSFYDQETKDER